MDLKEISGLLAGAHPKLGIWARIARDAIDAGVLGIALARSSHRKTVALALGAALAIGAIDVLIALQRRRERAHARELHATGAGAYTLANASA